MRSQLSHILWAFTPWIFFIVLAFIGVASCTYYSHRNDCDTFKGGNPIQSPDNKHELLITEQVCDFGFGANSDARVVTLKRTGTKDAGTDIFVSESIPPKITWNDTSNLTITIPTVMEITESLHSSDGIKIVYRLGDALSEENFKRTVKEWRERVIKAAKHPTLSYLNQIAFTEKSWWESFQRLRAWAKENVAQ